MHILERIEEEK